MYWLQIDMQETPRDWKASLAAAAASEAAVIAAITALGVPSFPIRADPITGDGLRSQHSFIAPTASRSLPTPAASPLTARRSAASHASLPPRVAPGPSAGPLTRGCLIAEGTARCGCVCARSMLRAYDI